VSTGSDTRALIASVDSMVTAQINYADLFKKLQPPEPAVPGAFITSIEMPWRLILSPHEGGRWRHSPEAMVSPVTQHTELWHSRLVTPDAKTGEEIEPSYPDPNRTTRAIWALRGDKHEQASVPMTSKWPAPKNGKSALPEPYNSDVNKTDAEKGDSQPFRTTLDNFDRYQIAHLSSNFNYPKYTPEPIDTNLMMLTALGGWLDSRGAWDPPGLSVEEWAHRATMGRDHYVRVVYKGFLFPFGHRVALIKVSERKFHNGKAVAEEKPGNPAYLRQRLYMVVREKERNFADPAFLNATRIPVGKDKPIRLARQFPFTKVKILTETTPDLLDPTQSEIIMGKGQLMFWPQVASGNPFRFQCVATDLDGRRVMFDLPMIFVDNTLAGPRDGANKALYSGAEAYAQTAMEAFNAPKSSKGPLEPAYNTAHLDYQRVALAPSLKSGDTTVQVEEMTFGGWTEKNNQDLRALSDDLQHPVWVPTVESTKARIAAIAQLGGAQGSHLLTYNPTFLREGFGDKNSGAGNMGEVFADLAQGVGPNLDFSKQGDKSGGFVQPNLAPKALSRLAGPVMSDTGEFIKGTLPKGSGFPDPDAAGFNAASLGSLPLPLLFGCIPLGALIDQFTGGGGQDALAKKSPKFASEAGSKVESLVSGLGRLYEFVSNIATQPASIGEAAMQVFKATLDDLIAQAKGFYQEQKAAVQGKISFVTQQLDNVISKLQTMAQQLATMAGDAGNVATTLGNLGLSGSGGAIDLARKAVADLKLLADNPIPVSIPATPGNPGGPKDVALPAGFKQSVLNAVQKIDTVLNQLEALEEMVKTGKALWDALNDIIGNPSTLTGLFSTEQGAADLEALLNGGVVPSKGVTVPGLLTVIGPFRTVLDSFDLLDGAPRKAIIKAVEEVKSLIGTVGEIAKWIKQLTGDEMTIRFDWNPTISSWGFKGAANLGKGANQNPAKWYTDSGAETSPLFVAHDKKGFAVGVEAKVKKSDPKSAKVTAFAGLKHFDLVLIAPASFIELNFEKIEFSVDSAAKMNVDVLLSDIKFVGPLSFVEVLRDFIPLDGFSDPPYFEISPKGIDAGFNQALPTITCGMMQLSNISLGAGFTVPFIGQPLSVRFNFCTRENPFSLTVYAIGGGGFMGITIDPHGVQILEASFEFGAKIELDFGVASGSIEIKAGLYFRMEQDKASLTGYIRMRGNASVMKIISVSIELYLSLEFHIDSGKCIGKAELKIEVSVFLFSISVTVSVERKIAGSNGDPSLRQMLGLNKPDLSLEQELNEININSIYGWHDHVNAYV
jgi:hypothetical protein